MKPLIASAKLVYKTMKSRNLGFLHRYIGSWGQIMMDPNFGGWYTPLQYILYQLMAYVILTLHWDILTVQIFNPGKDHVGRDPLKWQSSIARSMKSLLVHSPSNQIWRSTKSTVARLAQPSLAEDTKIYQVQSHKRHTFRLRHRLVPCGANLL